MSTSAKLINTSSENLYKSFKRNANDLTENESQNKKQKTCALISESSNSSKTNTNMRQKPKLVSDLWVDKYKPTNSSQVIGQQGDKSCVNKLNKWLSNWHKNLDKKPGYGKWGSDDGAGYKAALLSGAPGIGKTTAAHLVCKELGYDLCEMNASDARNKKSLHEEVKELLGNMKLTNFFANSSITDKKRKQQLSSKHVVIMDEVDGMSGNEDRGGVQELILLIKSSKVPIICICNDRSHPKIRSLSNYCFDLRFFKPRIEQIKGPMMSIAYKEGIRISPNALHELIVSSNQDIRQVLHNLSLLSTGGKRIENMISDKAIKDVRLGTFDAIRKVFTSGEEYVKMSFQDKSDLFFCDYSIMPLFVFENYINVIPKANKGSESAKLEFASKAIDAIAFGDIIDREIRSNNNWSLLPLQAAFASVMPGAYMNGHVGQQINFPSFLGKLSTTNKKDRMLQELKMHMNLRVSGSKTALNLDYLEPLRENIMSPLLKMGSGGVPEVIATLENYCLRREDIDSIIELTLWDNQTDPMSKVDTKTKTALTKAYNKEGITLPYSLGTVKKAKKGANNDAEEACCGLAGDNNEDANDDTQEDSDNDDIDLDAMIKAKKKSDKTKPKKTNDGERKTKATNKKCAKESTAKQSKAKKEVVSCASKGKRKEKIK